MRKTIVLTLFAALAASGAAQAGEECRETRSITGERVIECRQTGPGSWGAPKTTHTFDRDLTGRPTETIRRGGFGGETTKCVYERDLTGQTVRRCD
jgi:hypothetical protein